ncbi:MAG: hypothetical protein H6718_30600 [Polyangiaceae bacterium]|nr:hypothetical protein [Polyangiaceae bacterium]
MTARRSGRIPRAQSPARTQSAKTAKPQEADAVSVSRVEAAAKPKAKEQDVVLVTGPTDDGKGMNVLRAKNDTLQVGAVRPLEEGKPILGELVKLKPRADSPALFDVESQLPSPAPAKDTAAKRQHPGARATSAGPAQVATDTYRSGWDRIYKRNAKKSLPN